MASAGDLARALAGVALTAAVVACAGGGRGSDAVARVGQPAPDFTEPLAPSGTLSLSALRGHPVYLNFFATWCPPCNDEAPAIEALQRRYAARGLDVVGVDVLEDAAKAEQFRSEHGLTYPEIVDSGALSRQYRIEGLPVHVFIDRGGVVRKIVVGQMSPSEMRDSVEALLR